MKKVLITAALPYANGPLHFGHIAGAYLPADCYARYERLRGSNVLYICGSDEYGVAITLSAELAKRTPKEHVDHYHALIQEFFTALNISFDHYSRTTWPKHAEATCEFFCDLLKNGFIEEKETLQLYAENEKKFLADRYVQGICPRCGHTEARGDECSKCGASYEATDLINPRSKVSGSPLILKATRHWFLRFDLFKDKLTDWLGSKNWKPNVLHFAKSYVDDLRPRAITRDSDWGIPVPLPEAKGKVFYVWFDAPIGYISATKDWAEKAGNPDAWKEYWLDQETKYVQFIGKDNIPFHAVFFPAMEMGQNRPYKLVDELPANEFYNLEGRQFSKSEGWYIDLKDFFHHFTADQIRYAIAANAPETHDSEFTWKDFQSRCNAELLGKYGNLVNRVLVFAAHHCQGKIPPCVQLDAKDEQFLETINTLTRDIAESYETFHLRRAAHLIMELAHIGNAYFDAKKPWALAKDQMRKDELDTTLNCCFACLKLLVLTAFPIIPTSAQKVWHMLGYAGEIPHWDKVVASPVPAGQKLPVPEILFKKVEDETIALEVAKLKKETPMKNTEESQKEIHLKETITIDDVRKLDLRVGQIGAVERVPKSKKLLKLAVDLGFETRTIVAGIGEKMEDPSMLLGKKVIVVANLKPLAIMGVESHGMILAADGEKGLELPEVKEAELGRVVS